MRKLTIMTIAVAILLVFVSNDTNAGTMLRPDGAGVAKLYSNFFNWMRDDDGDGIPNCLDPDYVKPEDGSGYGKLKGAGTCSGDCDGTPDRIRYRTKLHLKDCQKLLISR
jgi:hypothetical protein